MPDDSGGQKDGKLPCDKLDSPADYSVWRVLMRNYFRVSPKMNLIFSKTVKITSVTLEDGTIETQVTKGERTLKDGEREEILG